MNPTPKRHYHHCLLCLGSNYDADIKLDAAIKAIARHFNIIGIGDRIQTEPEGDVGADRVSARKTYTNQALIIETDQSPEEIISTFKEIERQNGRTPESKSTGIVPLDIDLLTYDDRTLRPSDMEKTYVKSAITTLQKSCQHILR